MKQCIMGILGFYGLAAMTLCITGSVVKALIGAAIVTCVAVVGTPVVLLVFVLIGELLGRLNHD